MKAKRWPLRLLTMISRLVPAGDRAAWLREWDGELAYYLRINAGRASGMPRRWLASRLLAALQHAIWLRVNRRPSFVHAQHRAGAWSDLSGDVRFALRGWRRSPGFSFTVVLTLALGLGLAAAIFSFADGYLFRPLPFPGGDRAYYLRDPHSEIGLLRASDLVALRQSAVADYGFVEWDVARASPELTIGDRRVEAFAYEVSEGFRKTLVLPLVAGRDFTREDHAAGSPNVAWLSYRFWQREFGGDRQVIGRAYRAETLRGQTELHIVGILGPEVSSFDLNNQPPDIVVPHQGAVAVGANRLADPLILLPKGVSVDQASARIGAALQAAAPASDARPRVVTLYALEKAQLAGGRPTARVFFAGAMLILILASMNLVHLLLSRSAARAGEVATRAALGASRWRIVRGFLTESALLSACGIGVGLLIGKGLSVAIAAQVPQLPVAGRNLSMVPMLFDTRVVIFAVMLGLIVAVAGGLWPAWRSVRGSMAAPHRTAGGGDRVISHRLARAILASELTVATVVVVGAVFVGLGIYRYLNQPLGFDYEDRLRVSVSGAAAGRLAPGDGEAALRAIRSLDGVAAAGLDNTITLPRDVEVPSVSIDPKIVRAYGATTGHFHAWGMRLEAGRWFDEAEYLGAEPVAIVNDRFAQLAWPDSDPLGGLVRAGGVQRRVVGVIESRRYLLDSNPPPAVYLPAIVPAAGDSFVVWAPEGRIDLRDRLTSAVQAAVPGSQVVVSEITFDGLFARGVGEARFQTPVMIAFGVLAVALAGIGVFGLVSYLVEQRRREFGIRMALGAGRSDVWRTVVRESVQPTVIGLVLGCGGAYALESVVQASVFGWESSGGLAIALVAASLLVVAIIAALIPAARASRIDPAVTLRAD